MSRIVMIRHGETQWNAERRSQGWLDPPLNDTGVRQAELVGEHVRAHYDFTRVISSDLTRCTMTADRLGLEYAVDPMLREINTGAFGGMVIDEDKRHAVGSGGSHAERTPPSFDPRPHIALDQPTASSRLSRPEKGKGSPTPPRTPTEWSLRTNQLISPKVGRPSPRHQ